MSAFPSIIPSSVEWSLISNTQSFRSPMDGSVQTLENAGSRWRALLRFKNLSDSDGRTLLAFMVALRGEAGRFTLYDHSHPNPAGIATGSPLVNGASQTGGTLITDGWTNSVTGILKAGDYIGVNGELKMVTSDVDSDVTGKVTLTIEPPLRSSPADNAVITTVKPTTNFRLVDDNQAKSSITAPFIHQVSIACIESFT